METDGYVGGGFIQGGPSPQKSSLLGPPPSLLGFSASSMQKQGPLANASTNPMLAQNTSWRQNPGSDGPNEPWNHRDKSHNGEGISEVSKIILN